MLIERLHTFMGWPGCTHDNQAWQNSNVFKNHDQFFENAEYLLGDSAYSLCSIIVQPYKKLQKKKLDSYKEFFNDKIAKARVVSEHCIGIMKNRFPCLKCINITVDGKTGVKRIMRLFTACAILHNLLIDVGDIIPDDWYKAIEEGHYWTEDYLPNDMKSDRRTAVYHSIIEDYYS